jgi:hypothetical protein
LVGVDATERVPEHDDVTEAEVPQHGRRIFDVSLPGEVGGPVRVSVATLVEGDDPPSRPQLPGQRDEGTPLPEVPVEASRGRPGPPKSR